MDRTQELEEQVRCLSRTVDEMRGRVQRLEGGEAPAGADRRSRRGFLRMGAAAAAGALGWAAVRAVPAAAATGGYMVLGSGNVAENTTTLADDSATANDLATGVLAVQSKNFSSSELTTAVASTDVLEAPLRSLGDSGVLNSDGFNAWANGTTAFAIRGLTDTGTAVVGEALSGIGLYARGTGRIQQQPQASAGTPAIVGPSNYEQVRDANGILYIHNATGVWRRVNTLRTDAADGSGNPFKPFRLVDTRLPGPLTGRKAPGSVTVVPVAGQGSGASAIPSDAIAVVGNLTAVGYSGGGWAAIMPGGIGIGTGAGQFNPNSDPSSINFITGQGAIANAFVCGLGAGGVQVYIAVSASYFIIDITAYIQ